MARIIVYRRNRNILSYESVVTLVQQQMTFIGYSQSREQVALEIKNSMKKESRSALFVAYEKDDSAIGFAYGNVCSGFETKGDYFWLNELFVSEGYRSQGLGSELLEHVKGWAKEQGCAYLALVTHPSNRKAQEFYYSLGFELESLVWVDTYL